MDGDGKGEGFDGGDAVVRRGERRIRRERRFKTRRERMESVVGSLWVELELLSQEGVEAGDGDGGGFRWKWVVEKEEK